MVLPTLIHQLAIQLLTDFCAQRTPPDVRDHVRVEFVITGTKATIIERRPDFRDPGREWSERKVAVLEYDTKARTWALFAFNRNSQRMPYQRTAPTADLTSLIAEVESDPTHVFWG